LKRRLISAAVAGVAALALPVVGATQASAATGKSSIYDCTNRTITSDQHQMSVTCNTPGTSYYFQVQCSWYSAGQGGSFWQSSAWTSDNTRATATCGGSTYVTGVGATVYWRA
jgi:hypothetical protein